MNRRLFIKNAGAAALLAAQRLWAGDPADRKQAENEFLGRARRRIEQHRQGEITLAVRISEGMAAAGARIRLEQIRHHFLFGCNFFNFGLLPNPQLEEAYRERFAKLLNYATLPFYWAGYEREPGRPDYRRTEEASDWLRARGIRCKGHPLAWDSPAGSPRWLPNDFDKIQALSIARVQAIVSKFRDRIEIWDVVNEPTDLSRFKNPMNDWARHLGSAAYARLHLETARAANPNATLLVNDYRHDAAYRRLLAALRSEGKPLFDAVGLQSHMHFERWPLLEIWPICDRFADVKTPLHFTETTVVSGPYIGPGENWGASSANGEEAQAEYVPKFYAALFAHPSVQAITWWDFADYGAWQGAPAGWLRKDLSPKPVYERLLALIKGQWWTRAAGQADRNGEFRARAFFGQHRVSVDLASGQTFQKELNFAPGGPSRFTLTL